MAEIVNYSPYVFPPSYSVPESLNFIYPWPPGTDYTSQPSLLLVGVHMTKFWLTGSDWKWCLQLPVNILKNNGLALLLFPLLTRWSSYFELWCGSFMLRMEEQQNRTSLGSLTVEPLSPGLAPPTKLLHEKATKLYLV